MLRSSLGASGLRMMYEVYINNFRRKQVQGRLKTLNLGLIHNLGGIVPGACIAAVSIVGN